MTNQSRTKELTLLAILTALALVLGKFAMLPTPTGFVTLLDAVVYLTAFQLGKREGAIVGGLSAFLLDMISGYPQWMFVSLFAHGGQGYFAGFKGKLRPVGLILATFMMVCLYFLGSWLYYGVGAAWADVVHNLLQNIVGMILGYLLNRLLQR